MRRVSGYVSNTESEPRISGAPGLLSVTHSIRLIENLKKWIELPSP